MEKEELKINLQDYRAYRKLQAYCDSHHNCDSCIFSSLCEYKLIDTLSQTIDRILEKVVIED